MDLNQLRELVDGQGPVFWAAATSIALGLTLLVVAAGVQVRRLTARRPGAAAVPPPERRLVPAAEPVVDSGAARVGATSPTGPGPDAPLPAPAPRFEAADAVAARLKETADRLERIHQALQIPRDSAQEGTDSQLKGAAAGVDYVYRSGQA